MPDNNNWNEFITTSIAKISNYRQWRPKLQIDSRYLVLREQQLLNFVSNDYLGLSNDPFLTETLYATAKNYGTSSNGAPSMGGYSDQHEQLTANLAAWLGFADCLLFNSGYQLNIGLFNQLVDTTTHVWLAKNSHASHIDGILLSKAKFTTFSDRQIPEISEKIASRIYQRHLILCEGSFSMDGTCTYLTQLIKLKQAYPNQILLIIDDAHGVGALGVNGYGSLEQQGLNHQLIDLYIGTLGKAFASHGGFLAGNQQLIHYLRHTTRSQIFSTMLPPAVAAVSNASLAIIQSNRGRQLRQQLAQNILYFKTLANDYGLNIYAAPSNQSAIQLLMVKDSPTLTQLHTNLLANKILLGKIAYPTVAKNQPRLRVSLNATHTTDDIQYLITQLDKAINRC